MKIIKSISLLLLIGLLLHSCKSTQYTADNYDIAALKFGNEGGFAGTSTEYIVLENGQLFHKKPRAGSFVELAPLDQSFVTQCFDTYNMISSEDKAINAPGNMTYWLEYEEGDNKVSSKWGGFEKEPDSRLKRIYTNLIKIDKPAITTSK